MILDDSTPLSAPLSNDTPLSDDTPAQPAVAPEIAMEPASTPEAPAPADAASKTKRIMRADNPIILACVSELFRFQTPEQVTTRIRSIRRSFVTVDGHEHDSTILWVHGFQVTDDEDKRGFVGNFACIAAKVLDDKTTTLGIYKMALPLADHPHKKRPKQAHPNGAHPIMRKINKGHIYPTQEEAASDLQALHIEFPDVSIPASEEKLYMILYDRSQKNTNPVRKVVLRIIPVEDGFKIAMKDNKRTSGGGKGSSDAVMMQAAEEMMATR